MIDFQAFSPWSDEEGDEIQVLLDDGAVRKALIESIEKAAPKPISQPRTTRIPPTISQPNTTLSRPSTEVFDL
jgi:hypothetical protein